MLIDKKTKNNKLDKDWGKIVKQETIVLNDKTKSDKVNKYAKGTEEIKTLQDALDEKKVELKKKENSLLEEKQAIDKEKELFATGFTPPRKKSGWKAGYDAFKNNYRGSGWSDLVKAGYPADYVDNLYEVKGQTFKITEDQITKVLARVIYEVGKIDRDEFIANHGITDATDKANIENIFDEIVRISDEIDDLNKVGNSQVEVEITNDDGSKKKVSAWKDRKKTWDLPITYSEPQKVHSNSTSPNNNKPLAAGKNDGDNEKVIAERSIGWNLEIGEIDNFIRRILTDEFIGKLTKLDEITKEENNFDIYQAGDAYSEEQLKEFGVEVSNNNITTLYRSNLKYNETTKSWDKTAKMPISIQNGLKDWAKLFKSVFPNDEAIGKLEKSLKGFKDDTDPNKLLFDDLRSQTGADQPFLVNAAGYKLYEDLEGVVKAETELLLGRNDKIESIRKQQEEVNAEQRKITNKTAENKSTALEVVKISEEILEKKKEALKAYKLEDTTKKRSEIELRKIQKLILEIRYLENDGDATRKCAYENVAGNNCQTLVGTYATDGDIETKIKNWYGATADFWLVRYFRELGWDGETTGTAHAIKQIKENKDELLGGIEFKEKLKLYKKHFEDNNALHVPFPFNKEALIEIKKELGEDNEEETKDWRTALKDIHADLDDSTVINDSWKNKWTSFGGTKGKKLQKIDGLKSLLEPVKSDSKFLDHIKTVNSNWTTLKAILKEEPEKVVSTIALYEYEKLDDSAKNEKDKKKTQQKRRIAVKLGKSKESELTDNELKDALVKIETGELTFTSAELAKCYNASLQEITSDEEEQPTSSFLSNPLTYIITVPILIGIGVAIWKWDVISNWISGKKDEVEDDDEDDNKEEIQ